MLGNPLFMLVRSSAARAVSSSTRIATTGVRMLVELSVTRVLLSARVLVTAWPQGMRTRCIHHVHTGYIFYFFIQIQPSKAEDHTGPTQVHTCEISRLSKPDANKC